MGSMRRGREAMLIKRRRLPLLAVLAVLALAPAGASAASLYSGRAPRPGPALLYETRPVAPQLTNRKPWRAKPILVSGTTAYRKGEFLYQDFLYDDSGARLTPDPADPKAAGNLFSHHNGTYTYPTAEGYANNAADLVELRVKPLRRATAFRVTLNTLKDPSLVAFTIAIGGKEGETHPLPLGANVVAPADLFLTVHPAEEGMVGELVTADGEDAGGPVGARVDKKRRQIEVRVPHRLWNPKRKTVRLAAGVGLWDAGAGQYLLPGHSAEESSPGGAAGSAAPAAFFNVGFRGDEPIQAPTEGQDAIITAAWWRDRAQGTALAAGDISELFATVSFRKLARRVRDNSDVPRKGPMDRIYGSRFELSQGADFTHSCFTGDAATCPGQYQGRLQPYAIYIPKKPRPARGYGLTLLLHSLSANYNQYLGTRNLTQFGERGAGSIVITPEARGPDEGYENYGAADVFDVWSDVASRFKLDPGWTVVTGYSMGAIGSFKLAAHYPDLFARLESTVGDEGDTDVLASLRNIPVLMWNNHGDELVNNAGFQETADALDELGYRYELDAFQPCANAGCSALFPNHLQLAINDWYAPAAEFLGTARVERNPAHVTYFVNQARDYPDLDLVGDHAYWLSRLKLREGASQGQIDAVSHGFGVGDPQPSETERGTGTLEGGNFGSIIFTSQKRTWGEAPAQPVENRIKVTATGIESAVIHVKRARVDCDVEIEIASSDGPLAIELAGCDRTVTG
jgi:pimeloyl-ACP methyl ester carboxylesterase